MKNEQPKEKDSLTESDIKAIKEKYVNQFNSALLEFAEDVIKSPPTVNTISSVLSRLYNVSEIGRNANAGISSLNSLKFN